MSTSDILLNGRSFHVQTWGDPSLPPLLLLHGFPEYSGAWEELAAELQNDYYCIAPDQRGYGKSYAPVEVAAYNMPELVSDMAHLIHHFGGSVHVLGHDWGAAVAYALAIFQPNLVRTLIIMNGVHPVPFQNAMASGGAQSEASQYINALRAEESEIGLAKDNFAKLLRLFSANMDLGWLTGDRLTAYRAAWGDAERLRSMINWYRASPLRVADPGKPITDLPAVAPERLKVHCPHLVVWGANDTALLPESREGLDQFSNDLTLQTVEDADHWLHHQKPKEVAGHIKAWLEVRVG